MECGEMELAIYSQDDRLAVAQILVKNGYTVAQGKRKKTETGKQVEYLLRVRREEGYVETGR